MSNGVVEVTIAGNLTARPEVRFTQSGAAVSSFTVVSTPRYLDKDSGQWKDGEALFMRCNVWREQAERIAEGLDRGSRVLVTGKLKQRSFETREGEKRTVVELDVDEVAASFKFANVKIEKVARSGEGASGFGGGQQRQAPAADPWGSAPPATPASGWSDEPPF